jgi:hypothetical protein
VDRPAGTKDDPVAGTELASPKEATYSAKRRIGDYAALANDLTVIFAPKNQRSG